jgi:hypothetical protein
MRKATEKVTREESGVREMTLIRTVEHLTVTSNRACSLNIYPREKHIK